LLKGQQKAQQIGRRTSKEIRKFRLENHGVNVMTDQRRALRIWEKYREDLYDSDNCPKYIAIKAEEELNEDAKGPTKLKSEVPWTNLSRL
jgi:hypothetical protein